MQKEKLNRKNKGITLIALIITIIVMLILVGVSVTVALNGGLFSTAKTAKEGTEAERDKELALAEGTVEMEYYKAKANGETTAGSIDEYILESKGLKIGDKVNYIPGTGTTDLLPPEEIEGPPGPAEEDIAPENLGWRVLGINANGQIELVSENPTSYVYTTGMWFVTNFDNLNERIDSINTVCDDLYGNGTGEEGARSLKVEDIQALGTLQVPGRISYTYQMNDSRGLKIIETAEKDKDFSMWDTIEEAAPPEQTWELGSSGIILSDSNRGPEDIVLFPGFTENLSDIITLKYDNNQKEFYELISSSATGNIQLLANGYADTETRQYNFPYFVSDTVAILVNSKVKSAGFISGFTDGDNTANAYFRPVVTLNSNVEFADENSDGTWEITVPQS